MGNNYSFTKKEEPIMREIKKGNHKFFIGEDEEHIQAELTYKDKDANTIIADHTFVTEEWRGEGVARLLFNHLFHFARIDNLKIIPICPYIEKKMPNKSEYNDVLAESTLSIINTGR